MGLYVFPDKTILWQNYEWNGIKKFNLSDLDISSLFCKNKKVGGLKYFSVVDLFFHIKYTAEYIVFC
jgi:hypothetical protein